MADPAQGGRRPKRGFAGLKDLLSDVEVQPAAPPPSPQPASISKALPARASIADLAPQKAEFVHGASESSSSQQVAPPSGEGMPVGLITCVVIAIVAIAAFALNQSRSIDEGRATPQASATVGAPASSSVPPQATMPTLAVAAVNAHVRKDPSAKSKAIALLSRGTSIEPIEIVNGFVRFGLPDGRVGWISRDVVVPRTDAIRLTGLSAADYANARVPLRGIERLFAALQPYQELQIRALYQVSMESVHLDATLAEVARTVRISLENVDSEAASWYSLEAKSYADKDKRAEALQAARAVVLADPTSVDGHVALAYAAFRAGDFGVINSVAIVLPLLAPNSTNTWVIEGISAANTDNAVLASGAFALALRKSRNTKVTARVLSDFAAQSADPKVSQAINTALERWDQKL